jgi:hypothetical protein
VAICSVACTMRFAIGTIASAAEKNTYGAGTPACSSASVTGMKRNSQLMEGLIRIEISFVTREECAEQAAFTRVPYVPAWIRNIGLWSY